MGSSSSHMLSSKPPSSSSRKSPGGHTLGHSRAKRKLSAMFCGAFFSKSTFELEDRPESPPINYIENNDVQNSIQEASPVFSFEAGSTSSPSENMNSVGRNNSNIEGAVLVSVPLSVQRSSDQNDLPNSNGLLYHQPPSPVYDSPPRVPPGDNNADVAMASSSGLPGSGSGERDLRAGDLLLLDMVSISSNLLTSSIAEINRRESRRNSRRLFWDALSRRNFRRLSDSPTIVLATGLADDLGSHDRWLVDFPGDLHYNGADYDLDFIGSRRHLSSDQRWLLRSENSERIIGDLNDEGQQTALCSSGLHSEGTCLCDSFFSAEETSTLASISQIMMLADALFEVLDEIHNQSLSLSLSTPSLPAPESLVDSFPLKYHRKTENAKRHSNDAQQCHICLADYEEGDKLRVLPCHHVYHAPCVDKWLKEVNRVCPVCRRNVCEGPGECSVSNELSSQ